MCDQLILKRLLSSCTVPRAQMAGQECVAAALAEKLGQHPAGTVSRHGVRIAVDRQSVNQFVSHFMGQSDSQWVRLSFIHIRTVSIRSSFY